MPAKPLTPEQKNASKRLRHAFDDYKRRSVDKISQESLADELGIGQSAVSQYLLGKIPLNKDAAVKFAGKFECRVSDFSFELQREIDELAKFASWSPQDENMLDLLDCYRLLEEKYREMLLNIAKDLVSNTHDENVDKSRKKSVEA